MLTVGENADKLNLGNSPTLVGSDFYYQTRSQEKLRETDTIL